MYATGKHAFGQCGRCGMRARYTEMVEDGHIPGLRVHSGCREIKHPGEKPFRAEDRVALKHPAPDLDDDSAGDSGETLTEAMGWTRMMGGEE